MGLAQNWRRRGLFDHVKFIFPNAAVRPVSVNLEIPMPAWYDITSFDDAEGRSEDEAGILKTRDFLRSLLKTEADETGVPLSRIVIGKSTTGCL